MGLIALGFLTWYYTQTFANRSASATTQASTTKAQLQGEMALPPLGRVDPPMVERLLGPPPELPTMAPFEFDDFQGRALGNPVPASYIAPNDASLSTVPTAPTTVDRRLAGPVFVSTSGNTPAAGEQRTRDAAELADTDGFDQSRAGSSSMATSSGADFDRLLIPTRTPAVQAKVLPTQRLLLPKGTFLDCTLETAIDSSLPGMTTCVMTEVLRSTINIPPTVTKSHGDRIAVVVARDLDFRSVYELRPAAMRR